MHMYINTYIEYIHTLMQTSMHTHKYNIHELTHTPIIMYTSIKHAYTT